MTFRIPVRPLLQTCVGLGVWLAATAPLTSRAISLQDYARGNLIKIFVATKGAVMPNAYDPPGHLKEGTKALLLSGLDLTDLKGISTLMVEDGGRKVPAASIKGLHLYVNNNRLRELPEEIGALDYVEFFYCEFNQLSTLPAALAGMDGLIAMYFTGNRFTEIPAFVYDMARLTKLQFSKNQITELPPAIGRMKELRHFSMAGNRIAVLPDSIANLSKLRVCDLSDNRLTVLPEAFGRVQIVNQLRVRNNPLSALPAGFATMRATIDITGTNIDPARLSPEMRARISTEKPPGSKDPDAIVVLKPEKPDKVKAATRAADDRIDMQRVRELRARVQKGEKLSAEDQAYYDRGVEARNARQKQGGQPHARQPSADDDELKRATREVQGRPSEAFTVSEQACPLEVIEVTTPDKNKVPAVVRKPPGQGPFPAIIFLHGGFEEHDVKALQTASRNQPTGTRFLAAGYVIVNATFRTQHEQTRDARTDCLAMIEQVKKMPEVDARSVVLFGGSGGGSLAMELAGETSLCAIVAGEPATVLLTGMFWKGGLAAVMANPKSYYTPEIEKLTKEKIRKIACPVLIVHGDQHPLKTLNHEIIIPELKAAKKEVEVIVYPGQPHGFYWGRGEPKAALKCFNDSHAFLKKHLSTQPPPLDKSLVKEPRVGPEVKEGGK